MEFQCRQFQSNCRKFDEIGMDYYNSTLIAIGTIKRFSRIVKLCSMMAGLINQFGNSKPPIPNLVYFQL